MLVKYMSLSVFCHQLLAKPGDRTLSLLPLSVLSLPFQEQLSLLCTKAALLACIQQLDRSYRTPPYCVTGRPLSGRQGAAELLYAGPGPGETHVAGMELPFYVLAGEMDRARE